MAKSPAEKRKAQRQRAKAKAAKQAAKAANKPKPSAPKPKSNSGSRPSGGGSSRPNRSSGGGGNRSQQNSGGGKSNNQTKQTVAQRREAAAKAGVSMGDYKKGLAAGHYNKRGRLTAAGKENRASTGGYKPKGSSNSSDKETSNSGNTTRDTTNYNDRVQTLEQDYIENNPDSGAANVERHNQMFDDEGYLSYDSEKYQFQANEELKKLGYKAGDMLWKPGTLDNLNGRKLTGRIAKITANGNYIPEYEHEAANSNHQGSGFTGWKGEVGLGADQAAYNKTMSAADQGATDPRTGQVMQYDRQDAQAQQQQSQQYQAQQFNDSYNEPASANPNLGSVTGGRTNTYINWMNNNAKGPRANDLNINFNFDPYKFMQGQ